MNRRKLITQYSSLALTTATQRKDIVPIDTNGGMDIVGLDIQLDVTSTGTLSTAKNVLHAINRITLMDRGNNNIFDIPGNELDKLYRMLSGNGHFVTADTTTTGSAKYYQAKLNIPVAIKDQTAKIVVEFAAYSALATSGCTGATVNMTISGIYAPAGTVQKTAYFDRITLTQPASGETQYGSQIPDGKAVVQAGFSVGTESNITSFTFSARGQADDYAKTTLQELINAEKQRFLSGHITGFFDLSIDESFVSSNTATRFSSVSAGADTIVLYLLSVK